MKQQIFKPSAIFFVGGLVAVLFALFFLLYAQIFYEAFTGVMDIYQNSIQSIDRISYR